MKLYFSPGACSLAPHIVLNELGLKYEVAKVDLKTKQYAGGNFLSVNPKGAVPTLQLDNGEILTEAAVILQYLSDQKPEKGLIPRKGMEQYRCLEWLNYVATEMHKGIGSLFHTTSEEHKALVKQKLGKQFDYLSNHFAKNEYLMGSTFTAPDAYLFVTLNWTKHVGIDLTAWPKLMGFIEKVKARESVAKSIQTEKAAP